MRAVCTSAGRRLPLSRVQTNSAFAARRSLPSWQGIGIDEPVRESEMDKKLRAVTGTAILQKDLTSIHGRAHEAAHNIFPSRIAFPDASFLFNLSGFQLEIFLDAQRPKGLYIGN